MERVISIIVTYNRIDLLKAVLFEYEKMEVCPKEVLVVNNNSTDGTFEFLKLWENKKEKFNKKVINLEENIGGSGGFYIGMEYALLNKKEFDWVYLADDDAFPEENLFRNFSEIEKKKNIGAICGRVINFENQKIDLGHRKKISNFGKLKKIPEKFYKEEKFKLDLFTYVGTFINLKILEKIGNTKKDYFIYFDDTEHSLRIKKISNIYCYPKLIIKHANQKNKEISSWREYYSVRNYLDMIKNHYSIFVFYYNYYKIFLKKYIKYKIIRNSEENYSLIKEALKAVNNNELGIHKKYKPGYNLLNKD